MTECTHRDPISTDKVGLQEVILMHPTKRPEPQFSRIIDAI
jgi:hypothetical protein